MSPFMLLKRPPLAPNENEGRVVQHCHDIQTEGGQNGRLDESLLRARIVGRARHKDDEDGDNHAQMKYHEKNAHDWQGAIGADPPTPAQGLELWHLKSRLTGEGGQEGAGPWAPLGTTKTLYTGGSLLDSKLGEGNAWRHFVFRIWDDLESGRYRRIEEGR